MLFTCILTVIFICTYYSYNYFNTKQYSKNKKTVLKQNSRVNTFDMSDEEFCEPSGAQNRWNQTDVKKTLNKNEGSLFKWKRLPSPTIYDENFKKSNKRPKTSNVKDKEIIPVEAIEIIDETDDESETSLSEDSFTHLPKKNFKENDLTLNKQVVDNKNEKCPIPCCSSGTSNKINNPKDCNVPLPQGMPPVIAGVPVKFPVSPYKSQISVMNAVIKGCKNKEHCLLESPTGSGKTLALLCAALAWQTQFQETQQETVDLIDKNLELKWDSDYNIYKPDIGENSKEKKIINPKIYYGSRTHKQIEQVIREFKKTFYADKKMTILSSREYTCIRPREKGRSMTQICNDLRDPTKRGSCQFYTAENQNKIAWHKNLEKLDFQTPWDIEDLVQLGQRHEVCPYFAARNLEFEADIIFCPYNYLIDPVVRSNLKMDLTGHIVIIDEAHNIESICRDVSSHDLREDHLEEAIDDCKLVYNLTQEQEPAYHHIELYLTTLAKLIKNQSLQFHSNNYEEATSTCWTGEEAWELFKMNQLGDRDFQVFQAACESAINAYQEAKEDIKPKEGDDPKKKKKPSPSISYPTKELIESLVNALKFIRNPEFQGDYRCTISETLHFDAKVKNLQDNTWTSNHQNKRRRLRTIKFMCMNSALTFEGIAKVARCVVLASGTLSPTSTFESELGTRFVHKLHANHVVPKENVYVRGIASGPNGTILKATYQNVQTLPFKDDLGQLLLDVCQVIPHGVLCFFSSYSMMTSQIERWKETDIWDNLHYCKHVVQEPRSNNDLDEVMSEFRDIILSTSEGPNCNGITGALLLAVFRGKVAEGIDFSDNEARCVLTVGIPYAVQNDPVVKLKREYNDKHRSRGLLAGGEWYSVQAYRALNQALGRCIRHRNDWGAILLVDERLLSSNSSNYLPKWIREMRQVGAEYNLKDELKKFVNRLQISDKKRKLVEIF